MKALRKMHGPHYTQPTAVPMITPGYNLPAKYVIHIVGPVVHHHLTPELEKELVDCYRNVLDLCLEKGLKSVAFCCISTGVFGPAAVPAQWWLHSHRVHDRSVS